MVATLYFIASECFGREVAFQDPRDLPAQVGSVAGACVHALPAERRHDMGSVAEKKDPAILQPIRDPLGKSVDGLPDNIQRHAPIRRMAVDEIAGTFGRHDARPVVVREQHELQPAAAIGRGHAVHRPGGIAEEA